MTTCGYCGGENTGKYAKCWTCYDTLQKAKPGDKCHVCTFGTVKVVAGKYGNFKSCSQWMTHPGEKQDAKVNAKEDLRGKPVTKKQWVKQYKKSYNYSGKF